MGVKSYIVIIRLIRAIIVNLLSGKVVIKEIGFGTLPLFKSHYPEKKKKKNPYSETIALTS